MRIHTWTHPQTPPTHITQPGRVPTIAGLSRRYGLYSRIFLFSLLQLYVSDDMAAFCEVGSLREALNLTVVLEKEHQGKIAEGGAGVLERADPLVDDVVVRLVALSTNGTTKR